MNRGDPRPRCTRLPAARRPRSPAGPARDGRPAHHRPDRLGWRHRLRRDPPRGGPARRLDGRSGAGALPSALRPARTASSTTRSGRPPGSTRRSRRASRSRSGAASTARRPSPTPCRTAPAVAFLGVRGCEIAALLTQDAVLAARAGRRPRLRGAPGRRPRHRRRVRDARRAPASARRWAPARRSPTGFDLALTELDDGFVVRAGTPAGEALLARLGAGSRRTTARRTAASDAVAAARERMGDPVPHGGSAGTTDGRRRQPALGRDRRALPRLRQLHARLPDLLLHGRHPGLRPRRRRGRRRADLGQLLHPRVRQGRRRQLPAARRGPLPPVADPQVRDLVGPVRDVRAAWAAAAASRGARSASTSARSSSRSRRHRSSSRPRCRPSPRSRCRAPRWRRSGRRCRSWMRSPRPTLERSSSSAGARPTTPSRCASRPTIRPCSPAGPASSSWPRCRPSRPRPISVSRFHPDGLELTIRAAGAATRALCGLRRGDSLGLRGPMGRGWPVEAAAGHDVVIVTGGIGLAPLRPLVDALLADRTRFREIRLLYGARSPARPPLRRGAVRARRPAGPRRRADRGPRRAGLVRARRRRHQPVRPGPPGRGPGGRLHLRPGTDDGGDRGRPARPRASPTTGSS